MDRFFKAAVLSYVAVFDSGSPCDQPGGATTIEPPGPCNIRFPDNKVLFSLILFQHHQELAETQKKTNSNLLDTKEGRGPLPPLTETTFLETLFFRDPKAEPQFWLSRPLTARGIELLIHRSRPHESIRGALRLDRPSNRLGLLLFIVSFLK